MPEPKSSLFIQPHGPTHGPRSLRILIVDDDRDTLLTLMTLLRDEGHEVRGISNGGSALAAIREFEADAVLLDIGLPDCTGYDVAREVREYFRHNRRPVLIAVTAWGRTIDRMLAENAGFDHHLSKPYDPRALIALLAPLRLGTPK